MPSTKGFSNALTKAGGSAGKASGDAFSGKFGSALSALGKVGAAAFGAVATSIGVIGKQALDSYADFEQLQGGVQKLFGDAWKTVMDNAQEAYRTTGLSANQYMEQVTSFSAALISSLGGDTQRAAELGNLAMTSMADNVNVFGSNMEDVQNAFQGFAKQNYTMLDNLKLGYGGTKSEMQRLVKDASKLTKVQEKLGVTVDANSLSFDNIVSAIAVMQEEMKIAGTTTSEAMKTISGSISMTKAAWQNWLTGLADDNADIGKLTDNLVESIGAVADNIVPRLGIIGSRIVAALPEVIGTVVNKIPEVAGPILQTAFDTIAASVEDLLRGMGLDVPEEFIRWDDVVTAFQDVSDTAQTFVDNFTAAFEETGALDSLTKLKDGVGDLIGKLSDLLPSADSVKGKVEDLGTALGTTLGDGINDACDFIEDLGEKLDWLGDHFDEISSVIMPLVTGIAVFAGGITALGSALGIINLTGIIGGIGGLIANLPIVSALTGAWAAATGLAGDAWALLALAFEASPIGVIVTIIAAVVAALIVFFTQTEIGRKLWESFTTWLSETWSKIYSKAVEVFTSVSTFITEKFQAASTFASTVWEGAKTAITSKWTSIKTTVTNAVTNIKSAVSDRLNAAKTAASNAFNGVKEKMTKPFSDAKAAIQGAIDRIKGIFPLHLGNIFTLKLPHISVSGGTAPFGIGGKGSLPSFSVSWYAKGGIFDSPSVIGVGEAGKEAVVPIDKLRDYIKDALDERKTGSTYNVYLNDVAVNDEAGIVNATRGYLYELKRLGAI